MNIEICKKCGLRHSADTCPQTALASQGAEPVATCIGCSETSPSCACVGASETAAGAVHLYDEDVRALHKWLDNESELPKDHDLALAFDRVFVQLEAILARTQSATPAAQQIGGVE